jgi:hypothetical protein
MKKPLIVTGALLALVAALAWARPAPTIDNVDRWIKGNLRVDGTISQSGVNSTAVFDGGLGKFDLVDAGNENVVGQLTVGGNAFFGVGANPWAASAGGSVNITTADVTSSGASNLISYTLPANALNTTNRCLRITGWGTALNNANAKTVALDFGSQTVISKVLTVSIANTTWKVQAVVCRSGASTQDIYAEAWNPMGTAVSSVDGNTILYQAARTAGTQTDTATIVIKGKTTAATTTDVTMDGLVVEFI